MDQAARLHRQVEAIVLDDVDADLQGDMWALPGKILEVQADLVDLSIAVNRVVVDDAIAIEFEGNAIRASTRRQTSFSCAISSSPSIGSGDPKSRSSENLARGR